MITASAIEVIRGGRPLLQNATASINPGQKVALLGANGTGKSSFFALLKGELHADNGELSFPSNWQHASVAQETPALNKSAIEYVMDGDREFRRHEAELAAAEAAEDGHKIALLHGQIETMGGYTIKARAAEMDRDDAIAARKAKEEEQRQKDLEAEQMQWAVDYFVFNKL